ncbi:MAG: hypothetical protein ABIJ59_12285 [Pseudomonadota bacterium]
MKENNIKNILKTLLNNLIYTQNIKSALDIYEFVILIKTQKKIKISNDLDEIIDDLISLHHYKDDTDYSLKTEEIKKIYNKLE